MDRGTVVAPFGSDRGPITEHGKIHCYGVIDGMPRIEGHLEAGVEHLERAAAKDLQELHRMPLVKDQVRPTSGWPTGWQL